MPIPRNVEDRCGGITRSPDRHPCQLAKGFGTSHAGVGRCKFHGGSTPSGIRTAERELAAAALARLGVPVGNGDPFVLLEHAVQHSDGQLSASAALVVEAAAKAADPDNTESPIVALPVAAQLYLESIRAAARVGKSAVDAKVADRQQTIDMAMYSLLSRFITELFERFLPEERRPEAEVWAKVRFTELAAELEMPGRAN